MSLFLFFRNTARNGRDSESQVLLGNGIGEEVAVIDGTKEASLLVAMWKTIGRYYLLGAFFRLGFSCAFATSPLILKYIAYLLSYTSEKEARTSL